MLAADTPAASHRLGPNVPRAFAGPECMQALFRFLPDFGGLLSLSLGLLSLAGLDLSPSSVTRSLPAMTPNSALMAILAGTSLILVAPAAVPRGRSIAGKLLACALGAIAAATLLEYLLGVDLRIDTILSTTGEVSGGGHPWRPSPQTATAFLLASAALVGLDWQASRLRLAEILSLGSALVSLVALLGYLFQVPAMYGPTSLLPHTGMSIPTAAAVLAICLGTLAARAEVGLFSVLVARDSGGAVARQLLAFLMAFAVAACGLALGARAGFLREPLADALLVLAATVGGSALVLRVSWRLSRADAERERTREELRLSRERFELALRGADLATWDWNIPSGEVIFNARWAEMRGLRLDEVTADVSSWLSGIHPDDLPRVQKGLDDYFQGLLPEYEATFRVRTKSGDWIWILDRGKLFERSERGDPVRMVGTELDVTEQKRLEEELRLAEAKSSGILSISADAIVSVDREQRITDFNEGAERLFGHSRSEILGAPLDVLLPERFRAIHRRHVEKFVAGHHVSRRMGEQGLPISGVRKGGEEFPADAAISRLEVGGRIVLTVVVRDMTEHKRRESEQALLSEVGAILASSLQYEETLARVARASVRELADLCLVDLLEQPDEPGWLTLASRDPSSASMCDELERERPPLLRSVLETGRPLLVERMSKEAIASLCRTELGARTLQVAGVSTLVAVPLAAHGRQLGVLTLASVAPSRRYGPAEVRLAGELAIRVALSVENARLYRTAQRAVQARDDVLGIVAHDLRNPLGNILLQTSLLHRTTEPDQPARKYCETIARASKRMSRLIQDLLDVVSMDAGHLAVEPSRLGPGPLLSEAVEAQRSLAAQASLVLDLEADDLPEIWADRDRLMQVFENLLGNAFKFTRSGGRVTVGASPGEGEVLFWVSDTGPGIAADDLPHLFDRFWQARKAGRTGAGLGLPIVKGIVEAHGGHIQVESAVGRGTRVSFTIPTTPREQVQHQAIAASCP